MKGGRLDIYIAFKSRLNDVIIRETKKYLEKRKEDEK